MEDNLHHRNFRNNLSIPPRENGLRRLSILSPSQFPTPEINLAIQNVNPNVPENFYDLVAELNQLTLSSPIPHGQFTDKDLTLAQQSAYAGGSSGNNIDRVGSINGGGGGNAVGIGGGSLRGYNPFVDSGHIPISSANTRYPYTNGDLQRMRVESAVRGQMGMYMQLHGYPTPSPVEEAFRGFNSRALNSNAIAQGFNLHGLNSNAIPHELDNPYSQGLIRGGRGFTGFHDYLIPSNPIRNGFRSNSNLLQRARSYSGEYENFNLAGDHRCRHSYNFTSMEELKGRIYLVAKDQHGCRFLQKIFEEGKPEEIQMIYSEVKDHVKELMVDSFGNYLMQKMFELCSTEQITQLLLQVISDEHSFMDLCRDTHGTRAVQKLLEYLTTSEQRSFLVSVLARITVPLTKCTSGNHVIQQCLKCLPIEHTKHILNVVADNCLDIATDKSGCCVLQQCVAHAEGEPRNRLLAEIVGNALVLSEHPYGNYVVQFIVSLKMPQVTGDILAQLAGSYVSLSMNKYGSNVVEKCMKESSEEQGMQIIDEIIRSKNFLTVLQDPYGNYVAQSAFAIAKGSIRQEMVSLIQMHYSYLHSHPHGKRVLAKTRGSKLRA